MPFRSQSIRTAVFLILKSCHLATVAARPRCSLAELSGNGSCQTARYLSAMRLYDRRRGIIQVHFYNTACLS